MALAALFELPAYGPRFCGTAAAAGPVSIAESRDGPRIHRNLKGEGYMRTGYDALSWQLGQGTLIFLDGPVQFEPPGSGVPADHDAAVSLPDPEDLARVHRSYITAGCDVIRTPALGLPWAPYGSGSSGTLSSARPRRWVDAARARIQAARAASAQTSVTVAFTLGPHAGGPDSSEIVHVLSRLFEREPPDLVLVEALTVLRPSLYRAISDLRSLGLPLWLSFRRCSEGLCGIGSQHWADDGPDSFGHAVAQMERLGVGAVLVNCIPRDHVEGTIDYLRYFTDLPLGAYPDIDLDLGAPGGDGGPADFPELALQWRRAGAQVVGTCCGGNPGVLARLRRELAGETPPVSGQQHAEDTRPAAAGVTARPPVRPWTNARGRRLFPLPLPRLARHDGVAPPTAGDLLLWEYLYREGGGANQRCLHVGSGSGLLAVQLALNGATHVHAVDIDPQAVCSTLESAFLNDVSSSLTAEAADLTTWLPGERYELVVASVEQPATDPGQPDPCVREFDPWGRRLIDALIAKLPVFLAREGVAYLTQTSLISQRRTMEMLSAAGMEAQVVDWHFWPAGVRPEDRPHLDQIEQVSDAFRFRVADHEEIVVVYLLEIRQRRHSPQGAASTDANGRSMTWA
jgi:release factor glutamine methyltransferase